MWAKKHSYTDRLSLYSTFSDFHRKCFGNRLYIFYGPVTPKYSFFLQNTGKSPAIQHAAQDPLDFIQLLDTVITKTTSSGLVKHLAQHKKGIILSPEVFDILNKLMKSDEDNATGDVQLLCKLFSGERCSYHYSTEETQIIPSNTSFSILGSTHCKDGPWPWSYR